MAENVWQWSIRVSIEFLVILAVIDNLIWLLSRKTDLIIWIDIIITLVLIVVGLIAYIVSNKKKKDGGEQDVPKKRKKKT